MKTLVAAAVLLALASPVHAAPEGEWFLIFDTWFCDVHDCGEGKPPHEDFVHRDTYATRKQCLAEGRRLVSDKTIAPYMSEEAANTPIGRISPRCEWYVASSHPAVAQAGSGAVWACGKDVTVISSRNQFSISFLYGPDRNSPDADDITKWQLEGSRHFNLKWGSDVWLNGRMCTQTN